MSAERPVPGAFPPSARQAVYDVIALRRDIRSFRPDPVPDPVLLRILGAAHRAGSVGFMQPWDFVLLRSAEHRSQLYELFWRANQRAAGRYSGDRAEKYAALKLQGLLDAPLAICVTCDTGRGGPHVLGRDSIPETDLYSTCLAIQNLWLAARAEGIGVGWVSIVDNAELAACLALPVGVVPVAFLCVGYPVEFPAAPMLEQTGWRDRLGLERLVHFENWGRQSDACDLPEWAGLRALLAESCAVPAAPGSSRTQAAERLSELLTAVHPADPGRARRSRVGERLDQLCKPRGSLGRLERLAVRLAAAQNRDFPTAEAPRVIVFAGDHGVVAEGVSAYRPRLTAQLCYAIIAGGATVNALARELGVPLTLVDVGVDHDFEGAVGLTHRKVRRGSRNLACEAALTRAEVEAALLAGATVVSAGPACDLLLLGEVGIGNTTSAAALIALATGTAAAGVVGRGTGIGDTAWARKAEAITRALKRCGGRDLDPLDQLAEVGGLEIAALTGAILAAAARRLPVLLDGMIVGAAALVAAALAPDIREYLIASHRSPEPAQALVLEHLGLEPLLDLELRLGEASGAALALPLVRAACTVLRDVRTFREAGIEEPLDPAGLR